MKREVRKLNDGQVEAFDTHYVKGKRWDLVGDRIASTFSGEFHFLDVGGGNGTFADQVLESFPDARGTLLDYSTVLVNRNRPHPRKTTICASAEDIGALFAGRRFDLISYNWSLHHLVTGSFKDTVEEIVLNLQMARELLDSSGRISIFENTPTALFFDQLPSRLIYGVTSSKVLAPIARRAGSNTSGVGVCFLSKRQWEKVLDRAGLEIESFHEFAGTGGLSPSKQRLLLLRRGIPRTHLWCRKRN